MQCTHYTVNLTAVKIDHFQVKIGKCFSSFCSKQIMGSNRYPHSMFDSKNKKNNVNPSFTTVHKAGFKGGLYYIDLLT